MAPIRFKASELEILPSNHLKLPPVLLTTFKIMPKVVDLPLPLGPNSP